MSQEFQTISEFEETLESETESSNGSLGFEKAMIYDSDDFNDDDDIVDDAIYGPYPTSDKKVTPTPISEFEEIVEEIEEVKEYTSDDVENEIVDLITTNKNYIEHKIFNLFGFSCPAIRSLKEIGKEFELLSDALHIMINWGSLDKIS